MSNFEHVKIKPITDEEFNEMGIFSEHSINILKKQPILGVKERRPATKGTLVYLCGGEVGDSMMLWVYDRFTEPLDRTPEPAKAAGGQESGEAQC